MATQVITLRGTASLQTAAWHLHAAHVSGAPVRDRSGALVGVISKSDLGDLCRAEGSAANTRVEDAMTPVVWSIHPEEPAMAAIEMMVERGIHRVLVVSNDNQIEGIVTPMDILRAIARGEHFGDEGATQHERP